MRFAKTLLLPCLIVSSLAAETTPEDLYANIDPMQNYFLTEKRLPIEERMFQELIQKELTPQEMIQVYVQGIELGKEYMRNGQYLEAIKQWKNCQSYANKYKLPLGPADLNTFTYNVALAQILGGDRDNRNAGVDNKLFTLPIPKGIEVPHTEGYKAAVKLLESHLFKVSDDEDCKYLLNLAYMKLGKYPQKPFSGWRMSEDSFVDEMTIGTFREIASEIGLEAETQAGSIVVDDFDLDFDDDVLISSGGFNDSLRYFENIGNGQFVERTEDAGLSNIRGISNLSAGDINKDGLPDIYAMRGTYMGPFGKNGSLHDVVLLNRKGRFEDITPDHMREWAAPTSMAFFRDMNMDGWLDIVAIPSTQQEGDQGVRVYYNNGKQDFTLAEDANGMEAKGDIAGAIITDFNQSSFQDSFYSIRKHQNKLYFNNGFVKKGAPQGSIWDIEEFSDDEEVISIKDAGPCVVYDANNDGWVDFINFLNFDIPPSIIMKEADPMNMKGATMTPHILVNNMGTGFIKHSLATGLDKTISVGGAAAADLNNDGTFDLILGSRCPTEMAPTQSRVFINLPAQGFKEVTTSSGMGTLYKVSAIAVSDFDKDGDNDIFMATGGNFPGERSPLLVYQNPGNDKKWLGIKLVGIRSTSSPSGIKVVINVQTDEGPQKIYYFYNIDSGFGQGSSMHVIGLNDIRSIDNVEVFWPGMSLATVYDLVKPNHHYGFVEGMAFPKQID